MNTTYSNTLELIHADFRVQITEGRLRDTTTWSGSIDIVRRGKAADGGIPNKTGSLARMSLTFLNNYGRIFPYEYYLHFM